MTMPTRKNPRFAGVGLRKLLGWAQVNATTIGNGSRSSMP